MPIYDSGDVLVTPLVQSAVSRPDVIEVEHRKLGGEWHIQGIGEAGTVVDVIAHFRKTEKQMFDNIKRNSAVVKVVFDGEFFRGVISGEINYTRTYSRGVAIFSAEFKLLVQSEGVA